MDFASALERLEKTAEHASHNHNHSNHHNQNPNQTNDSGFCGGGGLITRIGTTEDGVDETMAEETAVRIPATSTIREIVVEIDRNTKETVTTAITAVITIDPINGPDWENDRRIITENEGPDPSSSSSS